MGMNIVQHAHCPACPLRNSVPTRQLLKNRKILRDEADFNCPFCKEEIESQDHIFLHCKFVSSIWYDILNIWDINWCSFGSIIDLCRGWSFLRPKKVDELIWEMFKYAAIWSFWKARNEAVFEDLTISGKDVLDLIKVRVGYWVKIVNPDIEYKIDQFVNNMSIINSCKPISKLDNKRKGVIWAAPPTDCIKFNVDGAARGKPGPAGIGGVLRNARGEILCMFASPIGIADSNVAEVLAIEKALLLVANSNIMRNKRVWVESDSTVALSWMRNMEEFPCALWPSLNRMKNAIGSIKEVYFVHTYREGNGLADGLAKMSVDRLSDFCEWIEEIDTG